MLESHARYAMFTFEPNKTLRNPSPWRERLPILLLAAIGLGLASYLAAYQLGFIGKVWDFFFGPGSERVPHSFVSRLASPRRPARSGGLFCGTDHCFDRWRTALGRVIIALLIQSSCVTL
jgi:hypothetical protein